MKSALIIPLFAAFILFFGEAKAEPRIQSGLSYTAMPPPADHTSSGSGMLKSRVINKQPAEEKAMPENEISTEIWEKYKALAAGTAAQKEPNAKTLPESPSQSSETQPEAAQEAPAKTGGFSNILQTYQQNKQQRSQLRSLQFNTGKPAEEDKGP